MKTLCILISFIAMTTTCSFAQTSELAATLPVVEEAAQKVVAAKTIKVKVKGVGCSRDVKAINRNVAKVNGVSICETRKKGAVTTFAVTYDPSVTTEKEIYSAVENTAGCSNQTARPYKVKL